MYAASRYLLPVEMYMALMSFAFGISGGLLQGYLWNLLHERGENAMWLWVFCFVGGMQFAMAGNEWFFGRHWPTWSPHWMTMTVHRSVFFRAVGSFLSTAMWFYVVSKLGDFGVMSVGSLWILSPTTVMFSMWTFYENQKVYCALDPKYDTSATLSFRR